MSASALGDQSRRGPIGRVFLAVKVDAGDAAGARGESGGLCCRGMGMGWVG